MVLAQEGYAKFIKQVILFNRANEIKKKVIINSRKDKKLHQEYKHSIICGLVANSICLVIIAKILKMDQPKHYDVTIWKDEGGEGYRRELNLPLP